MMNNLRINHFAKVFWIEFKLTLASEFEYRWQVLVWVISDMVQPFIFGVLWTVVANASDTGVTATDMVSYYFMVTIVHRFTQDWSSQFVVNSIVSGEFSKYLVKPFNYLGEMMGINTAIRTLRISLLFPFILIGYLFFGDLLSYDFSFPNVLYFFLAILGGFLINFLLGNTFALVAFFIKQVEGLRSIYTNLLSVLSGEYIPLAFLPASLFIFFEILPFRYILSFPIEIIMGDLEIESITRGFQILAFWFIALIMIYKIIYSISIRRYESEGI